MKTIPTQIDDLSGLPTGVAPKLSCGQALLFTVAEQRFALALEQVQEIQHIVELAPASGDGGPLVGVMNLRGAVVPVVDLREVLGLPTAEYTLETPMIVCSSEGQSVALVVDSVHDVVALPAEGVQEPPVLQALESRLAGAFAFEDGLAYLIDADALLGDLVRAGV